MVSSSTSWYFVGDNSHTCTTTTASHVFRPHAYYKSFDFGREMIMTKVTERHKENEGIDLIIENPSQGLDDLLVMQR